MSSKITNAAAATAGKLPAFLMSHLQGANVPAGASREFCALVKAIGESGSNHEEGRIIQREAQLLEARLKEPHISKRQMREYLIRLIYCEMLGQTAEFGYIHAVKFTQDTALLEKRVGYLAVSVLLHENHELIYLLVNTIQRDLKSTNVVEICKLINAEMIPAVSQLVEEKLQHPREIVRKKAVLCLHRFYQRSPSSVAHLSEKLRRALCDQDPGVMGASLNIFHDMALSNPSQFKDLTSSFVSILKQIIDHRLPKDFEYHKVPAPWLQVKLLRILALLGADDQTSSESMYEVLRECLRRADIQTTAAYAVLYQCVITCTSIYPSSQLVELAARAVARFLRSENNNLKYLGITALGSVVSVNPTYAAEHKSLVIDCLDDPDETLKRKTLDLLCKMTNPANVKVIVEKLISYLKSTVDVYLRKDLVPRVVQLAEQFAPDNLWYLETLNSLFRIAGDMIDVKVAHNLMRLIAEGTEDDEADEELRLFAAESYIELLEEAALPDILVQTMSWVVGEYAYLATDYDMSVVLDLTGELLERTYEDDLATKGWIITGISKLVAQTGMLPAGIRTKMETWQSSVSSDLQQRCSEVLALVRNGSLMRQVMPVDASCEDLEALARGAAPYKPPEKKVAKIEPDRSHTRLESTFRFEPYEAPPERPEYMGATAAADNSGLFAGIGAPPSATTAGSTAEAVMSKAVETPAASAAGGSPSTARAASSGKLVAEKTVALQVTKKRWGKGGDLMKKTGENENGSAAAEEPAKTNGAATAAAAVSGTASSTPTPSTPTTEASKVSSPPAANQQKTTAAAASGGAGNSSQSGLVEKPLDPEKKKLADSLFGGVGDAPAAQSSKRVSRARKSGSAPRASGNAASTAGGGGGGDGIDLLDIGGGGAPLSATSSRGSSAAPRGKASTGGGLLDGLEGLSAPAPAPTAAAPPSYSQARSMPTVPSGGLLGDLDLLGGGGVGWGGGAGAAGGGGGDNLDLLDSGADLMMDSSYADDLLGGGGGGSEQPLAAAPVVPVAAAPSYSFTNDSLLLPTPMAATSSPITTAPLSPTATATAAAAAPSMLTQSFNSLSTQMGGSAKADGPTIPAELQSFPHQSAGSNDVTGDASVGVNFAKVWRPQAVDFVLYLRNKTPKTLSGVMTKVDVPRGMQRVDDQAMATKLTHNLPPAGVKSQVLSFTCPGGVSAGLALKLHTSHGANNAHNLHYTLPVTVVDFLRPLVMDTGNFGSLWQQEGAEKMQRVQLGRTVVNIDALAKRCAAEFHLHHVQTIGEEAIMASQVLQDANQICLVHIKLNRPTVEVQVHTKTMPFTQAVLSHVASVLAAP